MIATPMVLSLHPTLLVGVGATNEIPDHWGLHLKLSPQESNYSQVHPCAVLHPGR